MSKLTTWKIGPQIRQIAIPMSIGMFFNTMYNVVDSYFAWLHSTDGLAAISISFPVFFLILALWFGMWSWVSVLISNAIWNNDSEKVGKYIVESLSFWLILWVILAILWVIFSPTLIAFLWAEWDFYDLSVQYMSVISLAAPFFIITFFANAILQSKWDTKSYRNVLIAWFFLNIILNPVLMFGIWPFDWVWFIGIALVTFTAMLLSALYLMYKVFSLGYFKNFKFKNLKPDVSIYKEIVQQWLPASGNMLSIAVGIFLITFFIALYSKEAVAAYWVVTRIEQIALMPIMWLNTAVLVLIWQANGAKLYGRVQTILKTALMYGVISLIILEVPIYIFASELMWLFTTSQEVIDIWTLAVRIWALSWWAYLVLFMYTSALQWMKKPNFALWIGLYRQILAPGIIFYLITSVFFFEIWAIWWAIFAINWVAAIIAYFYTGYVIKKLGEGWEE
jgi:putative MATE family efflux protein